MSGLRDIDQGARAARDGQGSPSSGFGRWGYDVEQAAMAMEARNRAAHENVPSGQLATVPAPGRRAVGAATLTLGAIGVIVGGSLIGYAAYTRGHLPIDVAKIGALGALAGGSVGAALGPAVRAVAWLLVTAATAAIGAGALWMVHRIDPVLLRSLIDRVF